MIDFEEYTKIINACNELLKKGENFTSEDIAEKSGIPHEKVFRLFSKKRQALYLLQAYEKTENKHGEKIDLSDEENKLVRKLGLNDTIRRYYEVLAD